MSSTPVVTAKSTLASLAHKTEVVVVGEYLTYMKRMDGRPDSFEITNSCQIKLADRPVLITTEREFRYAQTAEPAKRGRSLRRDDRVAIPAEVEVVVDPLDGREYRVLVARGNEVEPAPGVHTP